MKLTRYAIRHIPTGHYLPHRIHGRGYTHDEPVEYPTVESAHPRIFMSKKNAERALGCWLRGAYQPEHYDDYGNMWSGDIKAQPNRKANEMEVIQLTISLPD